MRTTATAIAAVLALGAGAAQAGTVSEVTTDLQGRIAVELDKSFELAGTRGLDLENVRVIGAGDVYVDIPDTVDNAVEFDQGNWGDVTAIKNITANGTENLEVAATAIANVATIEVPGSLSLEGVQINDGAITARANVTQFGAQGVTDVAATAIANAVTATADGDGIFDLSQQNDGNVFAEVNATVVGRGLENVNTAATAIGNVVSLELDGRAIGSISQSNKGNITAINNDYIDAIRDPATATAIANAISITQSVAQ